MSSGMSSDQVIKQEVIDIVGDVGDIRLRVFPQSSNNDQVPFSLGGLTFGYNGIYYGSCDAAWVINNQEYIDPYNSEKIASFPVLALEGTDALQRGSSGNAQYQRFHHALGVVKGGGIGVYYLRPGRDKIRPELFWMAYSASQIEEGSYLITQDLTRVKDLLRLVDQYGTTGEAVLLYIETELVSMKRNWDNYFERQYNSDWKVFADKRSSILMGDKVVKYAGRMLRSFTDGSQRSGHIAVGEMFLTKYFFPEKEVLYLLPKMTSSDVHYLDTHKQDDKEWKLLRQEPNVTIITMDDLIGLPIGIRRRLLEIKDEPLKGSALNEFNICVKIIKELIISGGISISTSG